EDDGPAPEAVALVGRAWQPVAREDVAGARREGERRAVLLRGVDRVAADDGFELFGRREIRVGHLVDEVEAAPDELGEMEDVAPELRLDRLGDLGRKEPTERREQDALAVGAFADQPEA